MKPSSISKPADPATRAAALAAAGNTPVRDADNPPTDASDWDDAIASRSLRELREKLRSGEHAGSAKSLPRNCSRYKSHRM